MWPILIQWIWTCVLGWVKSPPKLSFSRQRQYMHAASFVYIIVMEHDSTVKRQSRRSTTTTTCLGRGGIKKQGSGRLKYRGWGDELWTMPTLIALYFSPSLPLSCFILVAFSPFFFHMLCSSQLDRIEWGGKRLISEPKGILVFSSYPSHWTGWNWKSTPVIKGKIMTRASCSETGWQIEIKIK